VDLPRSTPDEPVDESLHSAGAWRPARELLGDALLAELLGVSESSLRRYSSGARPTPDGVARRLQAIERITRATTGSYNEYGVRRWFERAREQLGGQRPKDFLNGDWSPDDEGVKRVVDLARSAAR
jgi:DNA-binding transcriptional regulator YdaS (Cro superfamily)